MKVETTVEIEADLLEQVDDIARDMRNRSEIFETALREFVARKSHAKKRKLSREEEIEALDRIGIEEREEILETLSYQADL